MLFTIIKRIYQLEKCGNLWINNFRIWGEKKKKVYQRRRMNRNKELKEINKINI